MSNWKHTWVSQNHILEETAGEVPRSPLDMYIRTRWEDTLDKMPRPHSEILAYIQYDPDKGKWKVHLHEGDIEDVQIANHLRAQLFVEDYFKKHFRP